MNDWCSGVSPEHFSSQKGTLMEQISFAGVDIEVRRSRRRSIGLEVRPDGSVILRVPNRLPKRDALAFLQTKEAWLRKCLDQVEERESFAEAAGLEPLTEDELSALTKAARAYFTEKCAWLAPVVGVDYGRISIRHQKTRWGSCSTKGRTFWRGGRSSTHLLKASNCAKALPSSISTRALPPQTASPASTT